jgi:hypothetical protein
MAFAAGVEILTPKPASTIFARNPATHLVLRQSADGGERRLKVKAGNVIIDPAVEMQDEGKDYLHFRLPLVPGVNTFTILPGGEQFEVKYQAINAAVPPSSSKAYLFHQDEQLPKSCTGCHELRETSIIERLGLEAQESCAVCHQDILKRLATALRAASSVSPVISNRLNHGGSDFPRVKLRTSVLPAIIPSRCGAPANTSMDLWLLVDVLSVTTLTAVIIAITFGPKMLLSFV